MTIRALVLAAGLGTRLKPFTDTHPKCLAPIGNRPLLDYWMEALALAKITDVLINTHAHHQQVNDYLATHPHGLQPKAFYEPQLLGSAGTITANAQFMEGADHCLVIYADNLSSIQLGPLLHWHRNQLEPFTMLLFRTPHPKRCGIAQLDDANRIIHFEEKPKSPQGNLANAGLYVMTAALFREMAAMNAFDIGHDILPGLTGRMAGYPFKGYHRDIGNPEALAAAQEEFRQGSFQPGSNS